MEKLELVKLINDKKLNFLKYSEIVSALVGITKEDEDIVTADLKDLVKAGMLLNSSKKKFATHSAMGLFRCKIITNKKGFAFAESVDGDLDKDVFIPPTKTNTAMNGDIALVKVKNKNAEKLDGEIVEVVKTAKSTIVGTFQMLRNFGFVVPDDNRNSKDVYIPKSKFGVAENNDKVVAKIIGYEKGRPVGDIIEVLGQGKDDPRLDVLSIIRGYELIEEFPYDVLEAAKKAPTEVDASKYPNRRDFRKMITFTIDGEDARDLDDAVGIDYDSKKEEYTLYVHIADVGEYVKRGSLLDEEALARGTSVYFPNMVLPMLPRELSNGICSLNGGVDRLTLSAIMKLDKNGQLIGHEFVEGIINTAFRMTYTDCTKMLEGDVEAVEKYAKILPDLKLMEKLALILEKDRHNRGALDFDIPEPKIIVNPETMAIEKFERKPRTISDRIIESFMICANEAVAKHYSDIKLPFVYRIHEKPSEDKLKVFKEFAIAMGIPTNKLGNDLSKIKPKNLQDFLLTLEDVEGKDVINKVMLRSMQKAKYKPDNLGHFGLASINYCHFTSPIRRYPDLTIHRIIKDDINGRLTPKSLSLLKRFVFESSLQSSEREVYAEKAERDVDDYFKARYMRDYIGEQFTGIISGVTQFGIYVELENTCEGFIRISDLPGNDYEFIDDKYKLVGKGETFSLGQKVEIKVAAVHLDQQNYKKKESAFPLSFL